MNTEFIEPAPPTSTPAAAPALAPEWDPPRVVPVNLSIQTRLEMHTRRVVQYHVSHTAHPVFDADELTLRETLEGREVLLVVDRNVDALYGEAIRSYAARHLEAKGYFLLDADESKKTWVQAAAVCEAAMAARLGRTGVIVCVGGGIVLDTAGFAASIYRRGIGYVRVPTTLIGQVDVAVGIKQGINVGRRKNVLGSFHPPLASLNDATLLRTLPPGEIAAGFAEIVKMAVIADPLLFELLERHGAALYASRMQQPLEQARVIMQRAEAAMLHELQGNLFETDLRRLVDFGHSFSVAIESDSDFRVPHGIAVGFDMLISTGIAVTRGLCSVSVFDRLLALYPKLGIPVFLKDTQARYLHDSLDGVRAHRGGDLNLVVPYALGEAGFVQSVSCDEIAVVLAQLDQRASEGTPQPSRGD